MEGSGEKPNYDRAKNCALALLEEFCIDSAPVEPAKIARNLGITVNFAQFDNKFNNVSGFYNIDQNAIYVNIKENFPRMTFTIAHELGHQQLHRDSIKNGDYKVLYRDQNLNSKDPKEQEANFFAANFLVPRFLLEKYSVKKLLELELTSISELATVFAVSPQVIKYRLRNEYRIWNLVHEISKTATIENKYDDPKFYDASAYESRERALNLDIKRSNYLSLEDDRKARKLYTALTSGFVGFYIIIVLIIYCFYQFYISPKYYQISDIPIITLLSSTTANVIALGIIVMKYIFPNHNKK